MHRSPPCTQNRLFPAYAPGRLLGARPYAPGRWALYACPQVPTGGPALCPQDCTHPRQAAMRWPLSPPYLQSGAQLSLPFIPPLGAGTKAPWAICLTMAVVPERKSAVMAGAFCQLLSHGSNCVYAVHDGHLALRVFFVYWTPHL